MGWDDDDDEEGFGFNYDDLTPEEKEELDREMRERDERIHNHPLYQKAGEIYDIVHSLVESLPEEGGRDMVNQILLEDATILQPKIAGAMSGDSWLIHMENAAIIRFHAQSLLTQTSGLKMFIPEADERYIKVLREEMLEFRRLFNLWVLTFPTLEQEDYEDEWGLFIRPQEE